MMKSWNNTKSFSEFRNENEFDERKRISNRIRSRYNDKIPVICEVSHKSKSIDLKMERKKFLCPGDLSISQFMVILRKKLRLFDSSEALYLFVSDTIPNGTTEMNELYKNFKDEDGL